MANYNNVNKFVDHNLALSTRAQASRMGRYGGEISLLSGEDSEWGWANLAQHTSAPRSYFDYYFTGQDVRAYVAETGDHTEFGQLPLVGMGFNMQQNKAPIYGYASYTYDAVMRGNRMVVGTFSLATKYPDYMKRLLAAAAKARQDKLHNLEDPYPHGGLTEDDKNIETYWGRSIDKSVAISGNTEWSSHPPFSFVLIYGLQDTSQTNESITAPYEGYKRDGMLFSDHNQRLVEEVNGTVATRIILEACELNSVAREYTPDGQVLLETYQFFARDLIIPPPDYNQRKEPLKDPDGWPIKT